MRVEHLDAEPRRAPARGPRVGVVQRVAARRHLRQPHVGRRHDLFQFRREHEGLEVHLQRVRRAPGDGVGQARDGARPIGDLLDLRGGLVHLLRQVAERVCGQFRPAQGRDRSAPRGVGTREPRRRVGERLGGDVITGRGELEVEQPCAGGGEIGGIAGQPLLEIGDVRGGQQRGPRRVYRREPAARESCVAVGSRRLFGAPALRECGAGVGEALRAHPLGGAGLDPSGDAGVIAACGGDHCLRACRLGGRRGVLLTVGSALVGARCPLALRRGGELVELGALRDQLLEVAHRGVGGVEVGLRGCQGVDERGKVVSARPGTGGGELIPQGARCVGGGDGAGSRALPLLFGRAEILVGDRFGGPGGGRGVRGRAADGTGLAVDERSGELPRVPRKAALQ